jgi:uncharacterized membrane protein
MRTRSFILTALGVAATIAGALALVAADRYLTANGVRATPETAVPVLVVVLLGSVVLVALLALAASLRRPVVRALPAPSAAPALTWLLVTVVVGLVALGSVRAAFAPALTVTAAVLLFLVSVAAFGAYARALTAASHPYAAVARLGEIAVAAAEHRYPPAVPAEVPEPPPLRMGRVVPAPFTGYVTGVDIPRIVREARRANVVVVAPAVGAFITKGEPVLQVFALDGRQLPHRIAHVVSVADVRDTATDVVYDLGLLSDVAVGAIDREPGVAEAALDRIGVVLGRLGPRPFPTGRFADDCGDVRVVQPVTSWPRLVEIALADVAARCGENPRVRERLSALNEDLRHRVPPERAAALAGYTPEPEFLHPIERRVPVIDLEQLPT